MSRKKESSGQGLLDFSNPIPTIVANKPHVNVGLLGHNNHSSQTIAAAIAMSSSVSPTIVWADPSEKDCCRCGSAGDPHKLCDACKADLLKPLQAVGTRKLKNFQLPSDPQPPVEKQKCCICGTSRDVNKVCDKHRVQIGKDTKAMHFRRVNEIRVPRKNRG
jgi:hypothetical protein